MPEPPSQPQARGRTRTRGNITSILNAEVQSTAAFICFLRGYYDGSGPLADPTKDQFALVSIDISHVQEIKLRITSLEVNIQIFLDQDEVVSSDILSNSSEQLNCLMVWRGKLESVANDVPAYLLSPNKSILMNAESALKAIEEAVDDNQLNNLWKISVCL